MTAYYNEIDPYAAQWLRNLIKAGHIAPGFVDERSIEDVRPDELRKYTQCHFFAGVGIWSYALRCAGWDDTRPVWTGSCPCQPFSESGKGAGFADERHLWPAFQWLIEQCGAPIVFGEQVAKKRVEPWIDLVHADLEGMGYSFGCVAFPSAGVGAPHIRDRAYWVAHSNRQHGDWRGIIGTGRRFESSNRRNIRWLADTGQHLDAGEAAASDNGGPQAYRPANQLGRRGLASGWMANADDTQRRTDAATRDDGDRENAERTEGAGDLEGCSQSSNAGPVNGFWRDSDWLGCRDGRWRPIKPGTTALAPSSPSRVGRLRAYGNAINAQAAQVFIESVMLATQPKDTPNV